MKKHYINQEHLTKVYNALKKYENTMNDYPDVLRKNAHKYKHNDQDRIYAANDVPGMVNLNKIIKCMPEIRLKKGYKINYIATPGESNHSVIPYVLKDKDKNLTSYKEYTKHIRKNKKHDWKKELVAHMEINNTPEGFFDMALLIAIINNLYLFWHMMYAYQSLLYTPEKVDEFIKSGGGAHVRDKYTKEDMKKLKELDICPYVEYDTDGNIVVTMLNANAWYGIFWRKTNFKVKKSAFAKIIAKIQKLVARPNNQNTKIKKLTLEYQSMNFDKPVIKHKCKIML